MAPGLKIVTKNQKMSNWNPESGYSTDIRKNHEYPVRSFCNSHKEIMFISHSTVVKDIGLDCGWHIRGIKMTLTAHGEVPNSERKHLLAFYSEKTQITIKPKMIITSEGLRSYKPSQKKMFFSIPSVNCVSLSFIHKIIATMNVWPISHWRSADASLLMCQVLFCFFTKHFSQFIQVSLI